MLVLTRKPRQQIMIGDDIVINVVEVQGENVRIAIDAPREINLPCYSRRKSEGSSRADQGYRFT